MDSNAPLQIIDGDDEFDWEAAVREIDVACQITAKPSTHHLIERTHHQVSTKTTLCSNAHEKPKSSRQSTLDRFIGNAGPSSRCRAENFNVTNDNQDKADDGDERVSSVKVDAEVAQTWIYPVNIPLRDYQLSMTRTALFSNTLVALPTGLGKTLIAAVVMYNYFRWFPEGKIVFAAPSRPLVTQQIEACHKIVGIPQEWTTDMTGQTSPAKRECLWKAKRVFFVTPQVLERDIQSGSCLVEHLVCLVIDEAHRASGNYSYCVAVRKLIAVPVQLRILALTATPGSKQQSIQHVIDNLQISTLEYRNENDQDVIEYVQDRKIELMEVAMGQDAVEINNLLLEAIRPYAGLLFAIGVLQNRDIRTLSPCALLNSRDKFRQAPPQNLRHMKYGEVEGYFGVLITLYHIRKLLSSHGIRPAFEMLEAKLQQGSFARFMSRNEVLHKAKVLMQQSLSHGAPSPKLSKMLEVLTDHFNMKDSHDSRVIIFSNFRGSVRDIMDVLAKIGEFVKATEFIGQSSGKALKGQSQKVQQAVLQKFRAGGYNVIVATSIGEEGLDIMEVDLVICFDANVSPLRMIQRMGRTGRMHEGRVVVLACEGSELKGYMRKQANSKAISKHMRNGGINSFNFHSSPRMIPHIFKPEVQFVQLSIERFIPRGKNVKDDNPAQIQMFKTKLTDAESNLIENYFHPGRESNWKPSLIAFPHFQAFPSRVHRVEHSFRTGMLIDTMQHLHGLSFCRDSKAFSNEKDATLDLCARVESVEQPYNSIKDLKTCHDSTEEHSTNKVSESDVLLLETSRTEKQQCMPKFEGQNQPIHSYLFGSDFVSVNSVGRVIVVSVPLQVSHSKGTSASTTLLPSCLKQDSFHFRDLSKECRETTMQLEVVSATQEICTEKEIVLTSSLCNFGGQKEEIVPGAERSIQAPISQIKFSNVGDLIGETPNIVEITETMMLAASGNDFRDIELSPRLTDFIKSDIVPESPIGDVEISKGKGRGHLMVPDLGSPLKLHTELSLKSSCLEQNEKVANASPARGRNIPASSNNIEIQAPVFDVNNNSPRGCLSAVPDSENIHTPLANLSSNCSSKDWCLSFIGKSEEVEKQRKFKRLRKYGDLHRRPPEVGEQNVGPTTNLAISYANACHVSGKHGRGDKKFVRDVRMFIEEEAEVSSEVPISDDEEDEHGNNSYEDSFIDDMIDPTAESTQAEPSRNEMMAIYRRSLLTQSPLERLPNYFTDVSPDSEVPKIWINESWSSSGTENHSIRLTQTVVESCDRNLTSFQLNSKEVTLEAIPSTSSTNSGVPREKDSTMGSRKRKLSFYQVASVPAINKDQEFLFHSEAAGKDSSFEGQVERSEANANVYDYDQFNEGIDIDAVEEQAATVLEHKSELSMNGKITISEPIPRNLGTLDFPSFDLGI